MNLHSIYLYTLYRCYELLLYIYMYIYDPFTDPWFKVESSLLD